MNDRYSIPPDTTTGAVWLRVANADRAIRFYADLLGLDSVGQGANTTALQSPDGMPLLILESDPMAPIRPPRTCGLYHVAFLLPSRAELARALRGLVGAACPLQGAADHLVSEAVYLVDPEGNGIELYADREPEAWPVDDEGLLMGTEPLNLNDLMAELDGEDQAWDGLPSGTRVGHVHLQVGNLAEAERFYGDGLGLAITQRFGPGALFFSAGGYHHHVGVNTWAGPGAAPPPLGARGLIQMTLIVPHLDDLAQVAANLRRSDIFYTEADGELALRDPSGNGVLIQAKQ